MVLETFVFDSAEFLDDEETQREFLVAAFEDGNPSHISRALGVVARAHGMTAIAREAGVTREALYKALSEDGDPRLSTFLGVMRAMGLKLTISSSSHAA